MKRSGLLRHLLVVALLALVAGCDSTPSPTPGADAADVATAQDTGTAPSDAAAAPADVPLPQPDVPVEDVVAEDARPDAQDDRDVDGCQCTEDEDCEDGDLCTANRCEDCACKDGPAPDGAPCDDGDHELRVDRTLAPSSTPGFPHDPLTEADYVPTALGPTYIVRISEAGEEARVGTSCDVTDGLVGTRTTDTPGVIFYDLGEGTFAGGRLLFWLADDGGVQAELTLYGSGVPIVQSERGPIARAACPAR